ncbi:hypothetical protein GCM10007094_06680 [Pseudovibrio japonicus]|uniref:Uncharacterized protein n=1 Tax=Pseudovibrio japonicus TaxID=366534 RepID=A0ABQ3DZG4_9HYPH|nr:hypothetical protein GCM10007094_06680 [Pseudovibrio japonicus]
MDSIKDAKVASSRIMRVPANNVKLASDYMSSAKKKWGRAANAVPHAIFYSVMNTNAVL